MVLSGSVFAVSREQEYKIPRYGDKVSRDEKAELIDLIKERLKRENAVLVAHYYTDPDIQRLADESGGCVSDSLEMARFGRDHPADTILVAGVKFMGETAKILSPEKRVIMPTLEATCSLDIGCPEEEFSQFCVQHPDRKVVVYANTSAAVKAQADWIVTSSCAVNIVEHLTCDDETIIWAPDRYLGSYVQKATGADMLLWFGSCIVHEEFKALGIKDLKRVYPNAAVLVHPEAPESVTDLANVVGSTSQLIKAACELNNKVMIVATDKAIFYKMQQECGEDKILIEAPTAGNGATCKSCAHCPWMSMNSLELVANAFVDDDKQIHVKNEIRENALIPLNRMLDFTANH